MGLAAAAALAAMAFLFLGKGAWERRQEPVMAEELPALLQFTYYDKEQWEGQLAGICQGKLSYRELRLLLEKLGVAEYVDYQKRAGYLNVPRKDFFEVYRQIVDLLDVDGRMSLESRVFISAEAEDGKWMTQRGWEEFAPEIESQIRQFDMRRVYLMDGVMVALVGTAEDELLWENVFIHKAGGGSAEILTRGSKLLLETPELTGEISDTICDVGWKGGGIFAIYKKEDTIHGKMISYNEAEIEIEGYGVLKHAKELPVFRTYGGVGELSLSELPIGNRMVEFVVARQEVCGIVLREPATAERIRVLLLNDGNPYYEDVFVTAQEEFSLDWQGQQQALAAGTLVRASEYLAEPGGGCIALGTAAQEGLLYLADGSGQIRSLGYQGTLEIRRYGQGFCVVNELALEDYLTAVTPSEMPASYEMEALRAQAICARSYACMQLKQSKYAEFAANVDDSVNDQVYNKQERNERSTQAVRDTFGQVAMYQGELAETYYYSNSCGFSQSCDVWGMEDGPGYLVSVPLIMGEAPDISGEENFAAFIRSADVKGYDSDSSFYRWRAEVDLNGSREAVNEAIRKRRQAKADSVQIFDGAGNPAEADLSSLGTILRMETESRSSGGGLKRLRLICENGSILLSTEYNIRFVLGAALTSLKNGKGQPVTGLSLLPSSAFAILPTERGYVLDGGGYGHGIGMSQNGANGMAQAGMSYREILQTFYQGITIEDIYAYGKSAGTPQDVGN